MMDPDDYDYMDKRDELLQKSGGHKTYPFIFVGESFIGGYVDLVRAYETNVLQDLGVPVEYDF